MKTQNRENRFGTGCECPFLVNIVKITMLFSVEMKLVYIINQYQSVLLKVSYNNNDSHFYQNIHLLQTVVKILQYKR